MKKDLIFAPVLLAIGVALFLFRFTGMAAHIALSIVGVVALIVYTVLTKKEWKTPALEIGTRVCYGVALITSIIINISYIPALAVIHKITATLFLALMVTLLTSKLLYSKKN